MISISSIHSLAVQFPYSSDCWSAWLGFTSRRQARSVMLQDEPSKIPLFGRQLIFQHTVVRRQARQGSPLTSSPCHRILARQERPCAHGPQGWLYRHTLSPV